VITDEWDIKISPAGWAFSIWGVIYSLLGGFVYYQSKPTSAIPGGIDDPVIYTQTGELFAVNMISNAIWLVLFSQDTSTYFGLALLDDAVMLVSALAIAGISTHNHLNNW